MTPGRHDLLWDGRDQTGNELPAGSYICRVATAAGETTRTLGQSVAARGSAPDR